MNTFAANQSFETTFTDQLVKAMQPAMAKNGCCLIRNAWAKGVNAPYDLAKVMQKEAGDFFIHEIETGCFKTNVDLKVERNTRRNIFFETYSNMNCHPGMMNPGWGMTVKVDLIWYAFADSGLMATVNLLALREWLNEPDEKRRPRLCTFKEVSQYAHNQKNCTVGRLIPFSAVPPSVLRRFHRIQGTTATDLSRDDFLAAIETASNIKPVAQAA